MSLPGMSIGGVNEHWRCADSKQRQKSEMVRFKRRVIRMIPRSRFSQLGAWCIQLQRQKDSAHHAGLEMSPGMQVGEGVGLAL